MNDLWNLLDKSPLVERKFFIKAFVREIVVTGDNVLLKYTILLSKDNLAEESIAVSYIVGFGGPLWTRTTDPPDFIGMR